VIVTHHAYNFRKGKQPGFGAGMNGLSYKHNQFHSSICNILVKSNKLDVGSICGFPQTRDFVTKNSKDARHFHFIS